MIIFDAIKFLWMLCSKEHRKRWKFAKAYGMYWRKFAHTKAYYVK